MNITDKEKARVIRKTNKKISRHIANHPSRGWLAKIETLDQLKWWVLHGKQQELLSLAWKIEYLDLDDQLEDQVESGQITKHQMDRTFLMLDCYSALWKLIKRSFKTIKKELARNSIDLPFTSPSALFCCLCTELSEFTFLHCFEPYLELGGKRLEDWILLGIRERGGEILEESDSKKLKKLPHAPFLTKKRFEWVNIVLSICENKANSQNITIKKAWDAYNVSLDSLIEESVKPLHEIRSTTIWRNGKSI
jgi:hypothetical protein